MYCVCVCVLLVDDTVHLKAVLRQFCGLPCTHFPPQLVGAYLHLYFEMSCHAMALEYILV